MIDIHGPICLTEDFDCPFMQYLNGEPDGCWMVDLRFFTDYEDCHLKQSDLTALQAVAENPELVLVAVGESTKEILEAVLRLDSGEVYRLPVALKALKGDYTSRIGSYGYYQEIFVPYLEVEEIGGGE